VEGVRRVGDRRKVFDLRGCYLLLIALLSDKRETGFRRKISRALNQRDKLTWLVLCTRVLTGHIQVTYSRLHRDYVT